MFLIIRPTCFILSKNIIIKKKSQLEKFKINKLGKVLMIKLYFSKNLFNKLHRFIE
jgi:hypothetical protein